MQARLEFKKLEQNNKENKEFGIYLEKNHLKILTKFIKNRVKIPLVFAESFSSPIKTSYYDATTKKLPSVAPMVRWLLNLKMILRHCYYKNPMVLRFMLRAI